MSPASNLEMQRSRDLWRALLILWQIRFQFLHFRRKKWSFISVFRPGTADGSGRSSDRAVGHGAASGSSRIGLEEGWKVAKMKSCRFHLFPTTTSPVQKTSPGNVRSQGLTLLTESFVQADIAGQVLVIRVYLKSFREKISTELMQNNDTFE